MLHPVERPGDRRRRADLTRDDDQVLGDDGTPPELAQQRLERVAWVARGELEQNARELGVGAGFGAGGAVLAVYGVGFLLAAIAVALALVMPTWLALLIVALTLFAATAVLGLLARRQFQKGSPL